MRWSLPSLWGLWNQLLCWDRLGHHAEQKLAPALAVCDSGRTDGEQADIRLGKPVSSASKPQTGNKLLASPNVSGNSASWWCQSGDNRGAVVLEADLVAGFWEMKLGPCKEVKQNL